VPLEQPFQFAAATGVRSSPALASAVAAQLVAADPCVEGSEQDARKFGGSCARATRRSTQRVLLSGKVGKTVQILGQGFTGTTRVSFNGTTASFSVVSNTYLLAAVSAGATGPNASTGLLCVLYAPRCLSSFEEYWSRSRCRLPDVVFGTGNVVPVCEHRLHHGGVAGSRALALEPDDTRPSICPSNSIHSPAGDLEARTLRGRSL
jgi:hypothetical protein